MPLDLKLKRVTTVVGIYGPKKDELPERMRFLEPEAADNFDTNLSHTMVVSDMFRSPEASLKAAREQKFALPPGFSAHNYGLAIDIDVKASMKRGGFETKAALDYWMEGRGWYCHRMDHRLDSESWHYNYLGSYPVLKGVKNRASSIESKINKLYSRGWEFENGSEIQAGLAALKLYGGALDGLLGKLTKEAIRVFQRAWGLNDTGIADLRTLRTLAYVNCTRSVIA